VGVMLLAVVAELLPGLKTIGSSASIRLAFRYLRHNFAHRCIFSFCVPKIRKAANGSVAKKRYGNTSVGCNVMTVYTINVISEYAANKVTRIAR